jgi:hypothetical protein
LLLLCIPGDYLLALVRSLVASPQFVEPGESRHGSLVFFDFLGLFMVAYPQRLAMLLNCGVVMAVVAMVVRKYLQNTYSKFFFFLFFSL